MTGTGTAAERCDAYLDGDLSGEEALAFERDLAARPEVAAALGSALALRELLRTMPPLSPPPGLAARIAAALPLGRQEESGRAAPLPTVRAALAGASWFLRGPAEAVEGTIGPARSAAAGLAQVRWMLGPLGVARQEPRPASRRPIWRRVLGWK